VRAAENLQRTLSGKNLNVILEEISVEGSTWTYVPNKWIDSLEMLELDYTEEYGLLVRREYDVALGMAMFDYEKAKKLSCSGVVVTGQPGIGVLSSLIIG
jgi:hypothetical protein